MLLLPPLPVGLTGKMPGRNGHSPILGGGTNADNVSGCVSATGEIIMLDNGAEKILRLIKHAGLTAQQATIQVLHQRGDELHYGNY